MLISNIRDLAKEKNISITNLEKEAGLGNGTIGKWSNANPSVKNLKAVADVLGCGIDDLMKEK